MKKTMLVGIGLAGGLILGSMAEPTVQTVATVAATVVTPKPSGYCKKADHGKTYNYTTPSGKHEILKCISYTAWHWKVQK